MSISFPLAPVIRENRCFTNYLNNRTLEWQNTKDNIRIPYHRNKLHARYGIKKCFGPKEKLTKEKCFKGWTPIKKDTSLCMASNWVPLCRNDNDYVRDEESLRQCCLGYRLRSQCPPGYCPDTDICIKLLQEKPHPKGHLITDCKKYSHGQPIIQDCGSKHELWGGVCYEKCPQGYKRTGICNCEKGYSKIFDCSKYGAHKIDYKLKDINCPINHEFWGGQCYPSCPQGYKRISPCSCAIGDIREDFNSPKRSKIKIIYLIFILITILFLMKIYRS